MTDVSVVVPTRGRPALLERCLRGLAAQDGPAYDVIVVHEDDPATRAVLDRWADRLPMRALCTRSTGAAAKRNLGWRAAGAELVAFTDDDCEPAPGWLKAAVDAAVGADLVQGRVERHPDDAAVAGTFARTVEVPAPSPLYPNANLLYRRAALERVGGFDETLSAGEDTDLAWRVIGSGGGVAWAGEALVWHAVRPVSFAAHLRSLPRWSSLPAVARRHPGLRRQAYLRLFWKRSHPPAVLALAGLLAAPFDRRALGLVLPLLARRLREAGPYAGLQLAAADLTEVAVLLVGSVRHRSPVL